MLQPVRRRTWAPRGQTPVQYSWDRHDRPSVVCAVTLSPARRRRGVYFRIHEANITSEQMLGFLRSLRRSLGRKLLVVWDRWSVHRKAARLWAEQGDDGVRFEWLPSYAPDLNPAEQVWNHTKYAVLANYVPHDLADLRTAAHDSIQRKHHTCRLLASFFRPAGLKC